MSPDVSPSDRLSSSAGPLATGFSQFLRLAPSLEPLLRKLQQAARSEAPVLVQGPAGCGRSTLARALHAEGKRSEQALVEVDVAAVPPTLFESEFFGFEPGAFTGAASASPGRVGRAEGGTLLLDHVEELPIESQPKLLRLLAEKQYAPLGGRERRADLRFVAVASDDLGQRVERGVFRSDLFYRLEVLTFRVPGLEERLEDIDAVVEVLLSDIGTRIGRSDLEVDTKCLEWMRRYPWPGNLRQVRNVLERAVIESSSSLLKPQRPRDLLGKPLPLAEVERRQILAALAYTRGRQGEAAQLLGISRKSLWERRRRFDIP